MHLREYVKDGDLDTAIRWRGVGSHILGIHL